MQDISQKLQQTKRTIDSCAKKYGRLADEIQLLAVSKTQAPSRILEAYRAGQTAFGENYLQEARDKQQVLNGMEPKPTIEWHFIGPIQSNKTREIAEHFQWVHSVDRLKIAQRLSQQRPETLPDLNICLQINIDNEVTKSGITPNDLPALADAISHLPRIRLRGLMVIPAKRSSETEQRAAFAAVAALYQDLELSNVHLSLDTLSMGMSDDMEAAIAEGATIVRVGSAIFGTRNTP